MSILNSQKCDYNGNVVCKNYMKYEKSKCLKGKKLYVIGISVRFQGNIYYINIIFYKF